MSPRTVLAALVATLAASLTVLSRGRRVFGGQCPRHHRRCAMRSVALAAVLASVLAGEARATQITITSNSECLLLQNPIAVTATDLEAVLILRFKNQLIDTQRSNGGVPFPMKTPDGPPSTEISFFGGGGVPGNGTYELCFLGWVIGTKFDLEFTYPPPNGPEGPKILGMTTLTSPNVVRAIPPVPEPSTLVMGGTSGLIGLGIAWRRRRRANGGRGAAHPGSR
jgi:PEP-CTERM motif